jgi:hypothetical protein
MTRHVDDYVRPPKCKHGCGGTTFYIDKSRYKRKEQNCYCTGYHFIHRRGSPYCEHNPGLELRMRVERYGEDRATVDAEILARPKDQ